MTSWALRLARFDLRHRRRILPAGVLGATGIGLDVTTSLVAPFVLAIVIDDTVHLMVRYNAEARPSGSNRRWSAP